MGPTVRCIWLSTSKSFVSISFGQCCFDRTAEVREVWREAGVDCDESGKYVGIDVLTDFGGKRFEWDEHY